MPFIEELPPSTFPRDRLRRRPNSPGSGSVS